MSIINLRAALAVYNSLPEDWRGTLAQRARTLSRRDRNAHCLVAGIEPMTDAEWDEVVLLLAIVERGRQREREALKEAS